MSPKSALIETLPQGLPPGPLAGADESGAPSAAELAPKTYRFEVLRFGHAPGDRPRFQAYELVVRKKMSVLEALLTLQEDQDPSLAFRYSCRGAVCGSCGMSINGKLNLACRVQLHALATDRIVLEPLPGFDVLQDLVVDMDPFWEKYERVRPWLHAEISAVQESRISERQRKRIDQYVQCILCAVCYAACPARRANDAFAGPAALGKLYRFVADAREASSSRALQQQDSPEGVWGCRTIMQCIGACPKDVRPADGVRGVRRALLARKLSRLTRRNTP
jgi:succinate dehydrogenase / fumarate reductase iron-sulfur subunit